MQKSVKIILIAGVLILLAALAYWFLLPRLNGNYKQGGIVDSSAFVKPVPRLYGLAIDSFNIETNTVRRDENLGKILQKYVLHLNK